MGFLSLVVLLCIIIFVRLEVESRKSGPYAMKFGKLRDCEDQGTNEIAWTSLTQLENGNYKAELNIKKAIGTNFQMCVEGQEITPEGQIKVHQFNCKTCGQVWSIAGDYLTNALVAMGLHTEQCNLPVGTYTANNWNASQPLKYIPKMNYNMFNFSANYLIDGLKVGCNTIEVEFVPVNN